MAWDLLHKSDLCYWVDLRLSNQRPENTGGDQRHGNRDRPFSQAILGGGQYTQV